MKALLKTLTCAVFAFVLCGCATTYVPVSWGFGEKVQKLSRSDLTLATLFDRYDPERTTVRIGGSSFDEVMMPSEVKSHLGAYRPDTKLIYRNLYQEYNDKELRDLVLHEFAHHIWFTSMSREQRNLWRTHLRLNPSPYQAMVRMIYQNPADHDSEDFAFTVQNARPVDIQALATFNIITAQESDAILKTFQPTVAASR